MSCPKCGAHVEDEVRHYLWHDTMETRTFYAMGIPASAW